MVTLWFKPPSKSGIEYLKMVSAIKNSAHISLRDAKDAVEIERVTCEVKYKDAVIKEIEKAGGKLV